MPRLIFRSLLGAVMVCCASVAHAASPVSLEGTVQAEKTVLKDGVEATELVAPDVVVPGDHLLFTTAYRNDSAAVVQNFVVTSPVPSAVLLTDEPTAAQEVSVDGGNTWGKLAILKVSLPDGSTRPAQAADVTHVRWTVPTIAAGAGGTVQYRAVVR